MSSLLGTGVGDNGWFAGGAGGSEQAGYSTPYGNGGSGNYGGGGTGSIYNASTQTQGLDGTGGGGGAGTASGDAKRGGNGVVIIRYLTP